jgi:hypothetical protein
MSSERDVEVKLVELDVADDGSVRRGFDEIHQRLAGMVQFVGARLGAAVAGRRRRTPELLPRAESALPHVQGLGAARTL